MWAIPVIFIIFCGLASFGNNTEEKRCSSISFLKEMGKPRKQGYYNFCGSFTAADQIGQRLGLGGRVSALQVALNGYNSFSVGSKYPLLQNSFFKKMLSIYGNVTPENIFSDFQKEIKNENMEEMGGASSELMAFAFNLVDKICLDETTSKSDISITPLIQRLEKNIKQKIALKTIDSCLNKYTYGSGLSLAASPDLFYRILNIELINNCKNSIPMPNIKIEPKAISCINTEKKFCLDLIHEGLEKGRIVGIGYDVNHILTSEEIASDVAPHMSSIVARNWNNEKKTCEYTIRNSYGTRCKQYKIGPGISCTDGNITVTEEILVKMIDTANYLP